MVRETNLEAKLYDGPLIYVACEVGGFLRRVRIKDSARLLLANVGYPPLTRLLYHLSRVLRSR